MVYEYQVTIFSEKYKPISTIVRSTTDYDVTHNADDVKKVRHEGMKKICQLRSWKYKDMTEKYGYKKVSVRRYNKAVIDALNELRYNKIKEEKYASGEWKRPKKG